MADCLFAGDKMDIGVLVFAWFQWVYTQSAFRNSIFFFKGAASDWYVCIGDIPRKGGLDCGIGVRVNV
jgi:hypothetical protein